jgi:hypothetical protein
VHAFLDLKLKFHPMSFYTTTALTDWLNTYFIPCLFFTWTRSYIQPPKSRYNLDSRQLTMSKEQQDFPTVHFVERRHVFKEMKTEVVVFWVETPCSDVRYQSFGGPCCLHLQGEGPPKLWYRTTSFHDLISQKTTGWIAQFLLIWKSSNSVWWNNAPC